MNCRIWLKVEVASTHLPEQLEAAVSHFYSIAETFQRYSRCIRQAANQALRNHKLNTL